ncbi:uncharacterized protein BDZ99DRAFT_504090 [Mytilinidion resinicola]|uniref:Uncharacterized protein n=1 Tax=Mytilinidion resinicola TaxID=574789 RepID=A0A6A6XZW4_9PEZI|nr:uncharacterized protein BDZ99DRAFT_504090 [Mytilinidion resinicola]KAF2802062.1 hypothetical protein BDZ99DRAFT_504090 [Mytilinidion resinicola]
MGCGSCLMITLRLFQALCAINMIALGAWINHTVTSAREKGDDVINAIFEDPDREKLVRNFFDSLLQTPKRVWFTIGAGTWTLLYLLLLTITYLVSRRRARKNRSIPPSYTDPASNSISTPKRPHPLPTPLHLTLDLLTTLLLAGAFAAIASLALSLEPVCVALDFAAPETLAFVKVCPISKVEATMSGLTWLLFAFTSISLIVKHCCGCLKRRRERKARKINFDPAAFSAGSAPRMGYVAVPAPQMYAGGPRAQPMEIGREGEMRYDLHSPVDGRKKGGFVEVRVVEDEDGGERGKERKGIFGLMGKKGGRKG